MLYTGTGIKVFTKSHSKLPAVAVCLSIPFKCSPYVIKYLKCGIHIQDEVPDMLEHSCVAYAVFNAVKEKFSKSILELSKSKITDLDIKQLNDHLNFYWVCQGSLTAVRKTIKLCLSSIKPHALFSKYNEYIKFVMPQFKVDKDHFLYVAKLMINSIQSNSVSISMVSKVKIAEDRYKAVMEDIDKWFVALIKSYKIEGTTHMPPKRECPKQNTMEFKCNAVDSIFVAEYLSSVQAKVETHKGIVEVYGAITPSKLKDLKDKTKIKNYVAQKYKKFIKDADYFSVLLGFSAILHMYADADTIKKLMAIKPDLTDIQKRISSCL